MKPQFTSRATRNLAEIAEYVRTRNACYLALSKGLHLRADVSRRELELQPSLGRVLENRARDRVRQPLGQGGIGRSIVEAVSVLVNRGQSCIMTGV